ERRQEMLTVPHGNDDGYIGRPLIVNVGGLDHEAAGLPDQTEVLGRQESRGLLKRPRAHDTPDPRHRKQDRASQRLSCRSRSGLRNRCSCTMKYRMCALSTVCCALAFRAEQAPAQFAWMPTTSSAVKSPSSVLSNSVRMQQLPAGSLMRHGSFP